MSARLAARAMLALVVAVLVCIGLAFAGYAIFMGFQPLLSEAWAAAAAAALLLLPAIIAYTVCCLQAWRSRYSGPPIAAKTASEAENLTLNLLAQTAKDKPLLAVLLAALLGAASVVPQHRK